MPSKRGRPRHDDLLTPAEWRTVDAVRHGLTNREIASRRGISIDAIKYHVANAIEKLALADRKALRRWPGAPRESALNVTEKDVMELDSGIVGVGQIARSVSDIAAAQVWYRDTLGLAHLYTFGTLAFFDCGGTRLMLSQGERVPSESLLYFNVPDIGVAYRELAARGIEFLGAPHMIHRHEDGSEEWMAFFNDPDERPLAIMAIARPRADRGAPDR